MCITPSLEESSFRGRPLIGEKLKIPDNFKLVFVKEGVTGISDEENVKKFQILGESDQFQYWNLDGEPSESDGVKKALKWLEISKVLLDD